MLGDTPKAVKRRKRLSGAASAGRLWKHATLADIEGVVTRQEIARMFAFALVRNPWDRMVSYYHWLRGQNFDHPAVTLAKRTTFDAFVAAPLIAQSMKAGTAVSYVTDAAGRLRANHFVRLEHLEEDLVPLRAHLGFDLDLPHVNTSDRRADYRSAYTDASRAHVARICAEDIARFGYRFEP